MSRAPSSSESIAEKADNVQIIDSSPGPTPKDAEPVYHPSLTPLQEAKLWRKVDWHILPILTVMYLCSFLDRGNAKLQGITTQLDLTGNKYNIALVRGRLTYLVLKKLRPSRWLPGITVVWGVIMTLMGLVKTYPQLVGARVCLGVAEAGLFPGVVWYMSIWYPRHMLQFRVGLFYGAATVAGAFSGVLAYGISFMSGTRGLLGWSWIFILEGIATVVVGGVAFLAVLVDFPDTAEFLNEDERAYLIWRKSTSTLTCLPEYDNSTVGEEEHFEMRHLTAIVLDWQIWMQILVYMSIVAPLYGISLFLPFGYGTAISQLLTVPPYICATIVLMIFALWSDHLKMRSPFILAGLLMCLVGFSINISDAPIGAKYFGTFLCVSGSYAAFPGIVTWLGNNLAGQYKRGVGMAFHIGIGNFSGAIASNIYLSHDAPRYIMGHALELMFIGIGLVSLPITVLAYRRINARRDALQRELGEKGGIYSADELRRMGDRAPDFRYTL
ncbi:major facilitator superfamily domain-containing protein [Rhodofomes roseus]|uniref:Major facilitator superfamily domain-containing protein n=1 Tax=Rhodofomes roseus TaxID=34475 RepID=A0ABQ8KBY7_9APHY|nr:major facilitator superfamily domain-containing protein [Rhodofomes roseus]KAH9835023.1 major facilitator superfamily domain-containing protein [Rhodofomes roseus]